MGHPIEHVNGAVHPRGTLGASIKRTALDAIAVGGVDLLATELDGPIAYVVDGLIEPEDVVLLTGREKEALKTWILLDLAIALALGASWLGRQVDRAAGKILFIEPETSKRQIARRLRALCAARGIAPEKVAASIVFVFEPVSILPREQAEDPDTAGRHLDALVAIMKAPKGTYSLVAGDSLRQTLVGDENSSADAARYTQGLRELARAAGCPVIVSHHTTKSGDGSDSRSSRGSVELTAGVDVILSIDTSGKHPAMHVTMRNGEPPQPIGYRLVDAEEGVRLETADVESKSKAAKRERGLVDEEVLDVLRAAEDAVTFNTLRVELAKARNSTPGAKFNEAATRKRLDDLKRRGVIAQCEVITRKGTFEGYRLGTDARPDVGRHPERTTDQDPGDFLGSARSKS